MKKLLWGLVFGFLIFGSLFCYRKKIETETPISVEVTTVKQKDIYNSVVARGTIDDSGTYNVVFFNDTLISDVAVTIGQSVKKGDLLMVREKPKKEAVYFSQELCAFSNKLVSAASDYGIDLENNLFIPTVTDDEVYVNSPINGVITELNVSENQTIDALSVAAKISDYENFHVDLNLSENHLSSISLGQSVDITCDAIPGKKYKGKVSAISDEARKKGSLLGVQETYIPVKIKLTNADKKMKAGLSVTARICTEKHQNTLSLPYECILQDDKNRELVYVVRDGQLELRRIITGLELEQETEVIYGLENGEKVVKNPYYEMKNGQNVVVKE